MRSYILTDPLYPVFPHIILVITVRGTLQCSASSSIADSTPFSWLTLRKKESHLVVRNSALYLKMALFSKSATFSTFFYEAKRLYKRYNSSLFFKKRTVSNLLLENGSHFRGRAFIFVNMIMKIKSGSPPQKRADFQNYSPREPFWLSFFSVQRIFLKHQNIINSLCQSVWSRYTYNKILLVQVHLKLFFVIWLISWKVYRFQTALSKKCWITKENPYSQGCLGKD